MKLIFSSQPGRVHREKYTKIMACISNKWPLPLSPQIKTLFTNSRLICDRLWVLIDAFRRRRSYYTALHPQVGHSPPGRENGVWWHTQPPTPHDSGNSRRIRSCAAAMQCINGGGLRYVGHQQRPLSRWPLSPVIAGQMSGRRWRNYGIVRHLEQSRPRWGPMASSYGAAALDRRVYW